MQKINVHFRKFPDGQTIALWDESAGAGMVSSYQVIGQHAPASPDLIAELPRATGDEIVPLLIALNRAGYAVTDMDATTAAPLSIVYLQGKTVRDDGTLCTLWTRSALARDVPLDHHKRGLSYTATGYGAAIPSRTMVLLNGRWRRVYVRIYSNSGTAYLKTGPGEVITVQEA